MTENKMWIPDRAVETSKEDVTKQMVVAILGPPKSGKSSLAATAPKSPKFFFDPLSRLVSLGNHKNVFGKSYPDSPEPNMSRAWDAMVQDMSMFEYQKSLGNPIPGTIVYDDMDAIMDRAMRKFLVDNAKTDDVRTMNIAGQKFLFPFQWNPYTNSTSMVSNFLARGVELGCDVIAIFHEREEESEDSTPKKRKYTGKKTVHPPRASVFLPMFNEYWRITHDGIRYIVTTKASYDFDGATCLNIDAEETPNIEQMVEKHNLRLKENKG